MKNWFETPTRRGIFNSLGAGLTAGWFGRLPLAAAAKQGPENVYTRIGVKPIINCKGTFTIISGSQSLPEVKAAMDEASRHYVHLDELMDGVGRRLAELTRAEWGMISAGCAAALTHSTAAAIAGADPEKLQRLPDLTGMKNEVVMPKQSRNVYDHAIRMLGVKIVTVNSREEFISALGPRTAMVALLGETIPAHPMKLEEMTAETRKRGIPVIVDAAAERLTIPNVYLTAGADLVAYSGGKCFRGPQCSGLLLGRKDLIQAAWIHSAPHHAFGRSLKVGKEEIVGMLTAVEMWTKRNHDAEWKQWEGWLETIREQAVRVEGVQTKVLQPEGPSNYAPQLRISWNAAKLGASAQAISDHLMAGTPRILIPASGHPGPDGMTHLTVMPYMMMPGDDQITAKALYAALSKPPRSEGHSTAEAAADLSGQWDVEMRYIRGMASHRLFLEQKNGKIAGRHEGDILAGDLRGEMRGSQVMLSSSHRYEGTSLGYRFDGKLENGVLSGTVDLGEYGKAQFRAQRHFA